MMHDAKQGFKIKETAFIQCETDRVINNFSFKKMKNFKEEQNL